jgi:hypothetical protein
MEQKLKHLSIYLDCNLKVLSGDSNVIYELCSLSKTGDGICEYERRIHIEGETYARKYWQNIKYCKLILNPISNLINEFEVDGEKFIPAEILELMEHGEIDRKNGIYFNPECLIIENLSYKVIKWLAKHHFDLDDYIGKGFAVDANSL